MFVSQRLPVAIAAMLLMATAAMGQSQGRKSGTEKGMEQQRANDQNWTHITKQMEGNGVSLQDAIKKATSRVGGVAISARVISNFANPREAQRYEGDKTSQYRVEVLCRTDQGQFKTVTVDGQKSKVIGVSRAYAMRPMHGMSSMQGNRSDWQGRRDWRVGDRDYSAFHLLKASDLDDTTVKNLADQDLGHIADFAIDPASGRISYAALSFGGWMEMGDKLFAVPLNALEIVNTDRVLLDLTKQELKNANGFDQDNWPKNANRRWAADLRSTSRKDYELAGHEDHRHDGKAQHDGKYGKSRDDDKTRRDAQKMQKMQYVKKGADLIGMPVKNKQGEELGSISDLYLDPERSRVCFAVLSHGGWLGVGDKLFAIPWNSFEMTSDDALTLDISKKRLESSPAASASDNEVWDDPDWVITVYEFYHVDPYWQPDSSDSRSDREL